MNQLLTDVLALLCLVGCVGLAARYVDGTIAAQRDASLRATVAQAEALSSQLHTLVQSEHALQERLDGHGKSWEETLFSAGLYTLPEQLGEKQAPPQCVDKVPILPDPCATRLLARATSSPCIAAGLPAEINVELWDCGTHSTYLCARSRAASSTAPRGAAPHTFGGATWLPTAHTCMYAHPRPSLHI